MNSVKRSGGRSKTADPAQILSRWFSREDRIFLASYANDKDERATFPPREDVITDPTDTTEFLTDNDIPGRASYFAVNPVLKRRRGKDHVARIIGMHADIDFHGVKENRPAIEAAIRKLKLKPTMIIFSGHGLHLYWKYAEPLPPEQIPSHEARLRQLCELLAADKSAAEVARVLRLPGSHNSKNGEWIETRIVDELSSWKHFKVDDLDAWIEDAEPVLTYRPTARDGESNVIQFPLNAYQSFAREMRALSSNFNADELLDQMAFHDVQGHGIDDTYTKIIGAMVAEGRPVEDCLRILLFPTKRVYERDRGSGDSPWNERRAIRDISSKYRYFTRKDAKKAALSKQVPEHEAPKPAKAQTTAKGTVVDFDPSERPTFTIAGGELSRLSTAGEAALIEAREELYEQASGALVRPITSTVDAAHGKLTKVAELRPVKVDYLRDRLMHVADWERYDARSHRNVPTDCPKTIAETILAREGNRGFRKLAGIITCPTIRPDGSLLTLEGYDKTTRLLLVGPPALPKMPDSPTKADAEAALKLILSLLREFPFTDKIALAVAVSGIVTAVARGGFITAPMHIARASTPGSGKSFLWDITSAIVSGFAMPVISAGANTEELEKRLGAALMAARSLISIDNVNGHLEGDALCQLIERPIVDVRILGLSKMVRVEARGTTMFATGNNLTVVGDLCRRVIVASLDSKLERPELRTFKGDPVKKVFADRGKYAAAALTIVRAYLLAGRPDKAKPLASFGGWSDTVRSALIWLGMPDPVESMEITREEDPERMKLSDILHVWRAHFGDKQVKLSKVLADAVDENAFLTGPEYPELHDAVDAIAGWRGKPDIHKLGNWMKKKKGRIVDGLKLMHQANPKGGSLWWVETTK